MDGSRELLDSLNEETSNLEFIIEEICGINIDDYFKDKNKLTQKILERHLDEIIDRIEKMNIDDEVEELYVILAILIFETGSALPKKVKEELLNNKYDWLENNIITSYVKEFRRRLKSYTSI